MQILWMAPLTSEAEPTTQVLEVSMSFKIPQFSIIGLPAPEVVEATERVRAAIGAAGLEFPRKKVVVNLAPSHLRKRGTGADLAIALAILSEASGAKGAAGGPPPHRFCAWGELGLTGQVRVPQPHLARALTGAWRAGCETLFLPGELLGRAEELRDWLLRAEPRPGKWLELVGVSDLSEALEKLKKPTPSSPSPERAERDTSEVDASLLPPVATKELRRVALALSGPHHILWLGPKGSGKSSALQWLAALAPPADEKLRWHHLLLSELVGGEARIDLVRTVHPLCSARSLAGTITSQGLRPGELSRAHGGVLLADELPEWPRDAREVLREPLETGMLTLSVARETVRMPARFLFAGTGNLCECGGVPPLSCRCTLGSRRRYQRRLSGPILDRIDLVVVEAEAPSDTNAPPGPAGEADRTQVLEKVCRARSMAQSEWGMPFGWIPASQLEAWLSREDGVASELDAAPWASRRARHKALRVALTLASWQGLPKPEGRHLAEARSYRAPEGF